MATTQTLATALADRYAIERLIGEGGMATVYLARDLRHDRRVALKVLRPDLGAVVGVERFLSEIRVTANLQHPNLLPLFDSGAAGELLYYVMPYVEGESLRARLMREKQLPVDEAVRIATAIASALDYAHRHGVIHRDLKPENVLLQDGHPLVADFGIALAISNAGGTRVTQTGVSLGTPHYMSPEQATGDRVIDGRTDIYSLGALTYEMLTGEPPHVGATAQAIIARVLTERPRAIRAARPTVPEHVEAAVDCALEKMPADRFGTAREFADAISGTRSMSRTLASATARRATRRASRRELVAWSVAGLLAIAFGVAALRERLPAPAPMAEFEVAIPDSFEIAGAGSASSIALSEDGKTLVFYARRPDGQGALYVRRMDDRLVQLIRGTEGARSPVLSPDGTEVLFSSISVASLDNVNAIHRVLIRGGLPRTFADRGNGNGQVSWGDGDRIVMARADSLVLLDGEGGEGTVLARPDTMRHYVRYGFPDVLPGGRAALIAIWKGRLFLDSIVLGVVTIPGGKVTELGIRGTYPRYSTTGHLLYVTAAGALFAVPFDARKLRVSGSPFVVAEGVRLGTGGAAAVAVSRTGTLAFIPDEMDASSGQVPMIVDRAGHARTIGARKAIYRQPRVSPDGRQILFTIGSAATRATVEDPDIWRYEIATGNLQRVTTDKTSDRAIWFRDGSRIAYSKEPRDSVMFGIPLYAGAQPTVVSHAQGLFGTTDLGPNGAYAAFGLTTLTGSPDIWIASMDSLDHPRPFLAEPYTEALPRVSPDGKYLAYVTNRTGQNEVYVRRLPGGGEELKVSVNGGIDPAWSSDGREVFYRATGDSLVAVQISLAPRLTVVSRHTLFSVAAYYAAPGRSTYDVFPGSRAFLFLGRGTTEEANRRLPLVVRFNWAAALGTARSK